MARHNREGHGTDQRNFDYDISYQPDWLKIVKVTRSLDTGRQSSKTLFRNPALRAREEPGERVRTRIVSKEQGLDFEVSIDDPGHVITRIRVTCRVPSTGRASLSATTGDGDGDDEIEFTLDDTLPPPEDG